MKTYRYFDAIVALFVAVILTSNVASSAKIIDWGVGLLGLRLSFDAGTLLFPISYIFGDVLTEVYGYARARRVIWLGFFSLALMSVSLALVSAMPGESAWQGYAGDAAFSSILGGVASGSIMVASLVAFLFGAFSNSFVLAKMKIAMQGRMLWMRTIGSTLFGQAVDTTTFVLIACVLGVFPWEIAVSLILSNYIFKVLIEVLFTPVTYRVVGFLKRQESLDQYDRDTDFTIFRW
ncbi:MAG: queuosine precursor transporter [Candidatus Peribacteraceae bacterium]